jgi:hypothetical protein
MTLQQNIIEAIILIVVDEVAEVVYLLSHYKIVKSLEI